MTSVGLSLLCIWANYRKHAHATRKTLHRPHQLISKVFGCAASAVSQWPAAVFLQDIVPKRMPLSELIKRLRDTEQRQNGSICTLVPITLQCCNCTQLSASYVSDTSGAGALRPHNSYVMVPKPKSTNFALCMFRGCPEASCSIGKWQHSHCSATAGSGHTHAAGR